MTELVDRSIAALRANHDELDGGGRRPLRRPADRPERRRGVDRRAGALAPRQRRRDHRWSRSRRGAGRARSAPRTTRRSGPAGTRCRRRTRRPGSSSTTSGCVGPARGRSTPSSASALTVDLGFLPEPAPLGGRARDAAQRGRRPRVGRRGSGSTRRPRSDAESADAAARALRRRRSAFLLGFAGKADQLSSRRSAGGRRLRAVVDRRRGQRSVGALGRRRPPRSTARSRRVVRLLTGRLTPGVHARRAWTVTGNVTLDDLRKVFPGY